MSQTIEIVRFRVAPDRTSSFLAGRRAALDALRAAYPGLHAAHLAQFDEEQWVDIVYWGSKEQALAAADGAMAIPAVAEWAGHITEVISMEHAHVQATHA